MGGDAVTARSVEEAAYAYMRGDALGVPRVHIGAQASLSKYKSLAVVIGTKGQFWTYFVESTTLSTPTAPLKSSQKPSSLSPTTAQLDASCTS